MRISDWSSDVCSSDLPTANLRFHGKTPALSGIHATRVHGIDDAALPAVSSLGTRPTVDGVEPLLEAHVFDFDGDLYGRSEERRVGKECVSTCRSRWSP